MNTPEKIEHQNTLVVIFNRYANNPRFVIWGCMILVTILSVFFFSHQSLRLDEAQSLWQTSRSPLKILTIIAEDVHVPLYHMLIHYWQMIFGNGVYTARVFSLVFFLLSIPAMYRLAKLAYGGRAALFATALFSFSPFMNWYGNEIRMYSLFTFLVILNYYYFLKLSKESLATKGVWYRYAITVFLGMYSHYFFFLALFSQVIFFLLNRSAFPKNAWKNFLIITGGVVVLFAPWVLYVRHLSNIGNSTPLLVEPTTSSLFNTISQFLFGFQVDRINTILVSLWPLTVLLGFLALRKKTVFSRDTGFFITAFIAPMVVAFIISFYVRPVYLSRYLILTLPPLFLFLTWITTTYPPLLAKIFRASMLIIMLIMLGVQVHSSRTPVKEKYHEASIYLTDHATDSDVIAVSAPFTIYPIDYYYTGPAEVTTLPEWNRLSYGPVPPFDPKTLPTEAKALEDGHGNLWLLLSYDQGYEETLRLYFDTHYQRLMTKNFSPGLNLYEYKLRY